MILTISGKGGSGKSTVAKKIALKLGLKHFSIGDLMREMAKERGISLLELGKIAEKDKSIDKELDEKQIKLGIEKKNFIIDGRLTAYFIPQADVKIFLDATDNVRAERIWGAKRKSEGNLTLRQTVENLKKRERSERKRYKDYYKVDYSDPKLYDLIINTSEITVGEVVKQILALVEARKSSPKSENN
tara:strand:+ start:163 stop:726 length:564 start_codon:yes stop_codon:yes gene_type:complete